MKYFLSRKGVIWPVLAGMLVLLAGCNRAAEATPQATPTPAPPPLDVTYCDIDPSDLCLEGFGLDSEDRLLVLWKADDRFYADIYMRADGPEGEIFFECQQSENFLENIYCLGEAYPEDELIKLNIYSNSNDRLIAIGVFNVQAGSLPSPDVVFKADITPTPSRVESSTPSYPNPSYPNSSYPNPTSTP